PVPSIAPAFCGTRPPPPPTLFPYTTLFRSLALAFACVIPATSRGDGQEKKILIKEEFSKKELDKCWSLKGAWAPEEGELRGKGRDRKSTRLNSSHEWISYAVFCLKKKNLRT